MLEIHVQAPELAAAIAALAAAISGAKFTPENPTQMAAPTSNTYAMAPTIPQTPAAAQAVPVAASAPIAPAPTATTAVPVTFAANPTAPPVVPVVPVAAAPGYNQEQIMFAGAALVDAGRANELVGLLGAFGVQAVTQLKPEQLGAFATELRRLGAQI